MKINFYTDNFEQLLKEKSDEFRMYPSKRVWHSIYNDLHPSRKWPSIAMSMLLVIALLLIGYLNTNDNSTTKLVALNKKTQTFANEKVNEKSTHKNPVSQNTFFNDPKQDNNITVPLSSNTIVPASDIDITESPANQREIKNDYNKSVEITDTKPNDLSNNTNSGINNQPLLKEKNIIDEMDEYINSNRLLIEVAQLNNKTKSITIPKETNSKEFDNVISSSSIKNNIENKDTQKSPLANNAKDEKMIITKNENPVVKNSLTTGNKLNVNEEKAWIEDYALHNKSSRKKWKDFVEMEIYATPSIGYRKLSNNSKYEPVTVTSLTNSPAAVSQDINKSLSHKPSLGLEAGIGFSYTFAKKFRLKVGAQFNYTNYSINADETKHPVLTTLSLNDPSTGFSNLTSRTTNYTNVTGLHPVTLHNSTYQISLPIGLAVKLAGNKKIEWFAGANIQPSFIINGKANLPSSDFQNYVVDPSMLNKWNLNTAVETYISYKLGGYSLQVGPQLRYQIYSTYSKKYTLKENLYNMGLKVGFVKGF